MMLPLLRKLPRGVPLSSSQTLRSFGDFVFHFYKQRIPGHTAVPENEAADVATKEPAAVLGHVPPGRAFHHRAVLSEQDERIHAVGKRYE